MHPSYICYHPAPIPLVNSSSIAPTDLILQLSLHLFVFQFFKGKKTFLSLYPSSCRAFARARVFLAAGPALLLRGFVAGGGAPLGSGSSSWSSCRKPGSWGACPPGPVRPARPRPFLLRYPEWFAFPPPLDAQVQRGLPSPASPDSESRQHPPGHRLRGLWLRAGSAGCAFRP